MNRRDYAKTVASLPFITAAPSAVAADEEGEETNEGCGLDDIQWDVRGVWARRDKTGVLSVLDEEIGVEYENYNEWVSATLKKVSQKSDISGVVNLYDFRLISLYTGDYARSHFAHEESGLEVTIRRDPDEEVEYTAYVRSVDETWEEHREYASSSQIRLAQKLRNEREEYL
ncbi:hypothetical protein [Halobacterium salinarum]|uniref:hypothetical protein n=1 Tax=Halobacterium salinarum TaxID=2242 RepID=UPI002554905B|nr:hypothetical protein [Halobacterium salinarum]MDL0145977.1 hypothetical protein [Halobacterium salinarum]